MGYRKGKLCCAAALAVSIALLGLGCAPHQSETLASSGDDPAQSEEQAVSTTPWSPDSDCSSCHAEEADANGDHLSATHVALGVTCLDCHEEEPTAAAHDGGAATQTASYTNDQCFNCHMENSHGSWDEVAALTADSDVAKNPDGEYVNPHAPHPADSTADELECRTCHSMHSKEQLAQGCYSCHHSMTLQACADCHEDQA